MSASGGYEPNESHIVGISSKKKRLTILPTSYLVAGTGFEPMSASGGYEPNESHIVGISSKKKRLTILPTSYLVAGTGFEPMTFGL
jgi:hypothetical protein